MGCVQLRVKLRSEKRIVATKTKGKKTKKAITAQEMGRKGGRARARALTSDERTAIAKEGGKARQAKWRERKAGK
jgi:hypothetical protein